MKWREDGTRCTQDDNRRRWLGSYKSPEEAHRAYAKAAKEMHGEFARLN